MRSFWKKGCWTNVFLSASKQSCHWQFWCTVFVRRQCRLVVKLRKTNLDFYPYHFGSFRIGIYKPTNRLTTNPWVETTYGLNPVEDFCQKSSGAKSWIQFMTHFRYSKVPQTTKKKNIQHPTSATRKKKDVDWRRKFTPSQTTKNVACVFLIWWLNQPIWTTWVKCFIIWPGRVRGDFIKKNTDETTSSSLWGFSSWCVSIAIFVGFKWIDPKPPSHSLRVCSTRLPYGDRASLLDALPRAVEQPIIQILRVAYYTWSMYVAKQ